jgi:adenylylsulfate kinase-like enzyme
MSLKRALFLCGIVFTVQAAQLIVVMGPSCAGKSTLAKFLCAQLAARGQAWQVIDFDEVEENIEYLIAATNDCLEKNINVIIDTNTYEDEIEKNCKGAVAMTKIIVTAPLDVLLQRDERRTEYLKRPDHRAVRCRQFVIDSFNKNSAWSADVMIDSSQQSVQQACDIILHTFFKTNFDIME